MKEEGRCAGAGERGRDLPPDDAGLAHAGDDHAPTAVEQQPDGAFESLVDAAGQRLDGRGLRLQHTPCEIEVDPGGSHQRAAPDAAVAMTVSRAIACSRTSLRISGSSASRRRAFAASLLACAGFSWTSMNTASTPAATPAEASGSMYSASPPVTPSPPPGSCRLWVTSNTTGVPRPRIIGNARMSTTRLL